MADIDIVLERLVNDADYRAALADDPAAALSGYDLSEQDLQLLAGSLDVGDDAQRGVEQRTSKSAMVGLLASLTSGGGGTAESDRAASGDRVRNAAGTVDPSPASKYSAPINVARGDAIQARGVDDLTGRPVGQPQAAGLGAADRLNAQPSGSVTVPLTSSKASTSGLPALDGASKDTGYLNEDAPPEDPRGRHLGRPKVGEITVTRTQAADIAPAETEGTESRWGHEKWNPNRTSEDVAPPGFDDSGQEPGTERHHWIKYEPHRSQDAPPTGDWDGDVADGIKIEIGAAGQRAAAPDSVADDFLTVEDE